MWRFILRFRLVAWLIRFVLFPLFVFSLALFVFLVIGVSLYMFVVVRTAYRIPENPFLYTPALLLEVLAGFALVYLLMVYINKIWKYKKTGGK